MKRGRWCDSVSRVIIGSVYLIASIPTNKYKSHTCKQSNLSPPAASTVSRSPRSVWHGADAREAGKPTNGSRLTRDAGKFYDGIDARRPPTAPSAPIMYATFLWRTC
jgi:hypothetical protein